jgi:hypothetical protein
MVDGQQHFACVLIQRWCRFRVLPSLYQLVCTMVMGTGSAIRLQCWWRHRLLRLSSARVIQRLYRRWRVYILHCTCTLQRAYR